MCIRVIIHNIELITQEAKLKIKNGTHLDNILLVRYNHETGI